MGEVAPSQPTDLQPDKRYPARPQQQVRPANRGNHGAAASREER